MKRNFYSMVLILLFVLVIVAGAIFILRGKPADSKGADTEQPVVTAAPPRESASPASSAAPGADAPIETRPPIDLPTPTPAPASAPTPTPAPTPAPTPIPDAEGSFRSDTGTGLNLKVDWRTYSEGGTRKLRADVSIVSYSIFTSSQYQSITLRVGGKAWSADCPGISYDGKDQIVTKAASFTVDAPSPGASVSVDWAYGGTYSGKDLKVITAAGTVK